MKACVYFFITSNIFAQIGVTHAFLGPPYPSVAQRSFQSRIMCEIEPHIIYNIIALTHDFDPNNNDKEDDLDDDSDDFDDGFWYKPQTPGEEALGRGKNLQNDDRPPSLCGAHTQIFVFSDLDDRHHLSPQIITNT